MDRREQNGGQESVLVGLGIQKHLLGIPKQIVRVLGRFQRNHPLTLPRPNPIAQVSQRQSVHVDGYIRPIKKSQTLGKQGTDAEWRDGDDDGGNCSGVIRVM